MRRFVRTKLTHNGRLASSQPDKEAVLIYWSKESKIVAGCEPASLYSVKNAKRSSHCELDGMISSHIPKTQTVKRLRRTSNMQEILRVTKKSLAQVGEALGIRNLDPESGLIFVTGGTGVIGHRVALRLLQAGYPSVRLGATPVDKLADMNKLGAEIADFAWHREDTYEKALKGVKSVLVTVPYTKDWVKHFPLFLDACMKAGVKHFVKISFYHARVDGDPMQEIPLVKAHGACDTFLITRLTAGRTLDSVLVGEVDPHMSYTILCASHFMSNPFVFQSTELHSSSVPGTFYGSSGNRGVNYVSPNDVAEVAVRVLLEPRAHHNKEYTLTGPAPIDENQVADLLGKHLNSPIMYVDQPLHEFTRELQYGGDAAWMIHDLEAMEKVKASGAEEQASFATPDIELICGHTPEAFEEYLLRGDMMLPVELGAPSVLKPLKTV
jgi:NAD(P)H dehydrogenase (quinone)